MPSVKRRNRQQVHDPEHQRQQRCDVPEHFPAPLVRKDVEYREEAAYAFVSARTWREYFFELLAIAHQSLFSSFEADRY